jgi:hypothetical protein
MWPTGQTSAQDGYYWIHVDIYDGNSWVVTDYLPCWIVNGVWTTDDPGLFNPQSPIPPSSGGGGAQPSALTVAVASRGAGRVGYYVQVTPARTSAYTGVTGTGGEFKIASMPGGSYHVKVTGTDAGATPSAQVAERDVFCPAGKGTLLTVNFSATSVPTFGSGSDSSAVGSQGPSADLFSTLFVPSDASIEAVKRDMTDFWNWGPFGLVADLLGLGELTGTGMTPINIPNLRFNYHVAHGDGEYNSNYWIQPNGDEGHSVEPVFAMFTELPIWPAIRAMMGAAIWLMFAVGVLKKIMPKPTT